MYLDELGGRLGPDETARCKALVIPPAWREVWICPLPNGHLQATGTDEAGRRQYLYHPAWREKRDRAKHDRILEVAERLPRARTQVAKDLGLSGMPRQRALATAFRLLDLGLFRVGGEAYVDTNGTYGLATIEKRHVRITGDDVVFAFPSKSGKDGNVAVTDPAARAAVGELLRRRGGGPQLLAYRVGRSWRDVSSRDINEYVKRVVGGNVSAKDFRTWHGTVVAAVALAEMADPGATPPARRRAIKRAVDQVSEQLGNTPTVARKSYIDPRVVERYEEGQTIPERLANPSKVERAVRELLTESGETAS